MAMDLRPLALGELLDRTFSLYRDRFSLFVGLMLPPAVVGVALGLALQVLGRLVFGIQPGSQESVQELMENPAGFAAWFLSILLGAVVSVAIYGVALGATTSAVADVYLDRPTGIREAYAAIRQRVAELIGVLFYIPLRVGCLALLVTVGLGILAALAAFASPAFGITLFVICMIAVAGLTVFLLLRYAVAVQALVLEGLGPGAAMKRSAEMTRGYRGRVAVVIILMTLINYAAALLLQGPLFFMMMAAQREGEIPLWLSAISVLASGVTNAILGPLLTIALVLAYYDIRVRKEAFDLKLMLEAVEGMPGAASS